MPLGYICGYPITKGRGEIYTGSIFSKSEATYTLQGKAIEKVHERWGSDVSIDEMAVCKNKYSPFVTKKEVCPETGQVSINVTRMYGCHCHSDLRKKVIEKYGERRGWEPFGQWSLSKAKGMARKLTEQCLQATKQRTIEQRDEQDEAEEKWYKQIGIKGSCVWKLKHKYDNIAEELSKEKDSQSSSNISTTTSKVEKVEKPAKKRKSIPSVWQETTFSKSRAVSSRHFHVSM